MRLSAHRPYRNIGSSRGEVRAGGSSPDADLIPALGIVWVIAVVAVLAALGRHEPLGAAATCALALVIVIPFVVGRARARRRAGRVRERR